VIDVNNQVRKLEGQGTFDVYVAKTDGGSEFSYWKKNTTQTVKEVVVVFDNRNANVQLQDGMAILSLNGINNLQEMYRAIRIFMANVNRDNVNVRFHFVVENDKQRQEAEALGYNLRVAYEVVNVGRRNNNMVNDLEDKLKNEQNVTASGAKTIEVQKDTGIEKITVSDNKAYVNSGNLSIDREKYLLLQEWKNDPFINSRIRDLDALELDRLLTETVTSNLTTYRMESAREQLANDKVGEVAINKAISEDGLVNAELGIVENNVSNSNQYSAVEKRGENVQVVNASVTSSSINSGGISNNVISSNDGYEYVDSSVEEREEQTREVLNEFYIDEEYNVYNSDGIVMGKIGQDGLSIDYNNNTLMKNGQSMGYVGDYKDMGKSNNRSKPNVRTLKKPPVKDTQNKSAAFVSFPVIMFILSGLLLIGSVVLLFVLD